MIAGSRRGVRIVLACVPALALLSLNCIKQNSGGSPDAKRTNATGGAFSFDALGSGGTGLGGAGKREIGSGGVDAGDLGAGGAGGGNLGTGGGASMGGAGGGSGDETGTRSPADANFLGTGGTDTPDARPNVDTPDTRPDNNSNKDTATDNGPKDTVSSSSADGGIVVPDGYRLVWSDEFNGNGKPDPATWNYEKGFVRNNELQWYQADNASVQNGLLVIEGRKEQVTNPNYVAGSTLWTTSRQYGQYTASSMTTSALPGWQYGRFEMRARIPTSAGMWPAWWALGKSGEWPASGEIDMMEYYNGKVLANVACGTATRWVAKWDSATKALSTLGASWSANFHIWRMDWDTQNINLYLDDALMNGVPLASMLNADGSSPFKQPVYMIVNLAIGGDNGGDPSATIFPVRYEIDYIRVFQKL